MALTLTPTEEVAADLGQALRRRLDLLRARTLPDRTRPATDPSSDTGPGSGARESLPLFLDEPFGPVEASAKADLLALLLDASSHQQIVLLTDDEATLAWARLEAMTGAVGVVEPAAPVDAVEPAAPLGAVGGEPGRVA
jgi:hypothetical protein